MVDRILCYNFPGDFSQIRPPFSRRSEKSAEGAPVKINVLAFTYDEETTRVTFDVDIAIVCGV